jgi:hypothetical protein
VSQEGPRIFHGGDVTVGIRSAGKVVLSFPTTEGPCSLVIDPNYARWLSGELKGAADRAERVRTVE